MTHARRPMLSILVALSVAVPMAAAVFGRGTAAAAATALPSGFSEQVAFSGLTQPTKVVFAPDGRVFVAEKRGTIKVFDSMSDPTPDVFADLSARVHDYEDEGLLGLAVPPNFPANPFVYVSYTYDAPIGGSSPTFGDGCPTPGTGCVVSGRLSRLQANGNQMTGTEQVLINDWCTQFETHSMGDIAFGPDGALYASGGDGASASFADWGQSGSPVNPCGDPPGGVGGAMNPPTAEGGALRSQDVRTLADPTGLNGTFIRVDPTTGVAKSDNPFFGTTTDPNARRIVAYGLRNPYRWTFRPGTSEVWFGDVGWRNWEEIDRLVNPLATPVRNFGWPCYEGTNPQPGYNNANLNLCESLYTAGTATTPYYRYAHSDKVVPGESCPTGGSSVTGLAFYPTSGGGYPGQYAGALFFADYARQCIWAMLKGTNGLPDPSNIVTFAAGATTPVDLAVGPGNDLYYVDISGGTVRRIHFNAGNQPPTAVIAANPTSGAPPLVVNFSATGSSDPNGDPLTYQWDFTNDGTFDATGPTARFTYSTANTYTARLKVTDPGGLSDTTTVQILVGTAAPTAFIDTPPSTLTWATGDTINFTGHATDPQDGTLPPSSLTWQAVLQHCNAPDNCHSHVLQTFTGSGGSIVAPDHEYPSYLDLRLTATDSGGLTGTTVRRLDPKSVNLTFTSNPSGLQLTVGSGSATTPFTKTVIQNSTSTVSAPTPQTLGSTSYGFTSWSDGGAATHTLTAPATATTYTATYTATGPAGCADSFGYTCAAGPRTFVPANTTVLPITGDDTVGQATLPFPVKLYGQTSSTAWVDTNGVVSLVNPGGSAPLHTAIPNTATPNAAVYAYWGDLVVDASASIRTTTLGTAPNRQYVIEWRNVHLYGNTSRRLTAEAILSENGNVIVNYANLNSNARGTNATVGIENAAGTVGLQYSYNQAVLASGTAIVFTAPGSGPPPPTGSVSGTVTNSQNGQPLSGATVTLSPGGVSTTTNSSGSYSFTGVAFGSYTVTATYSGASASSPVTVDGAKTVNLAINVPPSTNYTVTTGPQPFVPANTTVLALTGDDNILQVTTPFPIKLYGQTYTTGWVDTNGVMSFVNPGGSATANTALPSTAQPNASVYPFWDDLVVDGSASVRTTVTGTAPNRKYVVEWRNVYIYGNLSRRLNAEVIFSEDGTITFNYTGLDNAAEQGNSATVGIEHATGTTAVQYSFNQPILVSGTAVVFHPPS